MNIINENLNSKKLEFNSAIEFRPEISKTIELYKSYSFDVKKNNYFKFSYNGTTITKYLVEIFTQYSTSEIVVLIEGLDKIDTQTIRSRELINIYFNLTKPGIYYIKYTYKDDRYKDTYGSFSVYPLQKTIDILDFQEQIYFFNFTLATKYNEIIFTYNVKNLTEDRLIYFTCSQTQFEICDSFSQKCNFITKFYKFLANSNYTIHVYSYSQDSYNDRRYMKPYVFGVFNKDNIKKYNNLGVDKNNQPMIYLIEKKYISSNKFYFININYYLYFYNEIYEFDELFDRLPNLYFYTIRNEYEDFDVRGELQIILVFPEFNYESKTYDNYVIAFANDLYINSANNGNFEIASGNNGFIIIKKEEISPFYKFLRYYYNNLILIKSQKNNIAFVDNKNGYDKLSNSLIINSKDIDSNFIFIFIEKTDDKNIINLTYYEARYSYFYALDNKSLNNRTKIMKGKGLNSYFKRQNSEIGDFYDIFNKITLNIDEKVNIYFRKYYGYSNIFEIDLGTHYDISNLLFLTKPIKTYENEKSILNRLCNLESNKLYSGYLDYQSLYDIYIDFDIDNNEESLVKIQKEDNPFNNLIKLFKPKIKYLIDFEVHHLIKLDPNFNATVTIKDFEKTIILDKNNPITTEIKGNYVQISTNSNAMLYFYNSILALTSTSEVYKNMSQYEIEPQNEKNLLLDIILLENYEGDIHYLIDVGFEGYTPFEYHGFDISIENCYDECNLILPNYFDLINSELVKKEKLFIYYYIVSEDKRNLTPSYDSTYYTSLKKLNNKYTFLVVPPNIEGEEEKNLFINYYNKKTVSLQVHYCTNLNYEGNKPLLIYKSRIKKTKEFVDSETFLLDSWGENYYIFNFDSKNEFVFSYFFIDKYDNIINTDSFWISERKVVNNLKIKKAEINFETNTANIQAIPNYIKSTTKYFIIIGPKNDTFTLDSFNNPCFLVKIITENSLGTKIYEVMNMGDEYIDVNIDISDLISQNSDSKDFIVNIVSLELRFEKKLNFYRARFFEKNKIIHINEDINLEGNNLFYELEYTRPNNNIGEICFMLIEPKSSSFSEYEIIIHNPKIEENIFNITKNEITNITFECSTDGSYSIYFNSLSKKEIIQAKFKIISTGIPFDLDLSKNLIFNLSTYLNYSFSPLTFIIDSSKISKFPFIKFNHKNIKIFVQMIMIEILL